MPKTRLNSKKFKYFLKIISLVNKDYFRVKNVGLEFHEFNTTTINRGTPDYSYLV